MRLGQHLRGRTHLRVLNDSEKYLNEGVEDGSKNFDILGWWKGKVATYHVLANMARDIFSIPITYVASERAFSSAGRVLDPFHCSLTPELVECLVSAQYWFMSGPLVEVEEKIENLVEIEKGMY